MNIRPSQEEHNPLIASKESFVAFLQASPLAGLTVEIKRDKSKTRDTDLSTTTD